MRERVLKLLEGDSELAGRLASVRQFSKGVRTSEYHLTNACNIRCKGCWFFEYEFDEATREETSEERWIDFARQERERGITSALLIGGEPTLFESRVAAFVATMPYVTISSNGVKPLPYEGYENVNVALTLFGGGGLDDGLRGYAPSGRPISGLFDRALENYFGDPRVVFIFALTNSSVPVLDETVRRIADNGNQVTFNFYSNYGTDDPLASEANVSRLLAAALDARERFPEAVACAPYFIEVLLRGASHFGSFGYETCPSISVDHPAHAARLRNGNPTLPGFNTWAADTRTLNYCCTSGHCEGCRDSQAVYSWLMVSLPHFLGSKRELETWVDVAESYWRQFVWSPYHPRNIRSEIRTSPCP